MKNKEYYELIEKYQGIRLGVADKLLFNKFVFDKMFFVDDFFQFARNFFIVLAINL